jgi:hypothetical protein
MFDDLELQGSVIVHDPDQYNLESTMIWKLCIRICYITTVIQILNS